MHWTEAVVTLTGYSVEVESFCVFCLNAFSFGVWLRDVEFVC